jgi:hypothetical protein
MLGDIPTVFHDWMVAESRIECIRSNTGVEIRTRHASDPPHTWTRLLELTEEDATLFAASLLSRAGHGKLAKRALKEAR